jgi:type II secretory pathway component PulM
MIEKIKDYIESRPPRERAILIAGAAVAFIFILYWLIAGVSSGPSKESSLERAMADQEEFLQVLKQYNTLHDQIQQFDTRLNKTQHDLDLFAMLNNFAQETGIREQIIKMDPSEGAGTEYYDEQYVDMNLQQIPLEPLTRFLQKIEQAPAFLRITRITIKRRYDQSEALDVNLRVNAYMAKQT